MKASKWKFRVFNFSASVLLVAGLACLSVNFWAAVSFQLGALAFWLAAIDHVGAL